jgi:hypothetical protein
MRAIPISLMVACSPENEDSESHQQVDADEV